jgi:hypothetical protein
MNPLAVPYWRLFDNAAEGSTAVAEINGQEVKVFHTARVVIGGREVISRTDAREVAAFLMAARYTAEAVASQKSVGIVSRGTPRLHAGAEVSDAALLYTTPPAEELAALRSKVAALTGEVAGLRAAIADGERFRAMRRA